MPQPCARKRMSICSFGSRRGYRCLLMASYFSAIPAPCSLLPPLLSISAISLPPSLFRYCYLADIYLLPLLTRHLLSATRYPAYLFSAYLSSATVRRESQRGSLSKGDTSETRRAGAADLAQKDFTMAICWQRAESDSVRCLDPIGPRPYALASSASLARVLCESVPLG